MRKTATVSRGGLHNLLTFLDHDLGNLQAGVSAVDEVDGPVAGIDQQIVAVVVLQDLGVAAQVQVGQIENGKAVVTFDYNGVTKTYTVVFAE